MPKKKGPKAGGAAATAAVCHCEHPFNCECGNRPPRPSRGHRWDAVTKTWGGKGHKQKGAALGQAATVGKDLKVITTNIGQTTLQPHQRLPSTTLAEVCQKQKRHRPFYKEIKTAGSKFQYRLIIKADKADDLHFVPSEAVANAEQAKEEAALLALLHLTPSLPHERKFPEPYRTTWLDALKAQKESSQKQSSSNNNNKKNNKAADDKKSDVPPIRDETRSSSGNKPDNDNTAARASTGLRSAVAVNRTAQQAKRQQAHAARNARLARHEAIRLANQPHPVFMSAKLRRAIERILRQDAMAKAGEDDIEQEEEADEDDAYYVDSMDSDVQEYVETRLHDEGFTRKQARQAFQQGLSSPTLDNLEQAHEQALQWLLVHVNEEDLPPSFDPRGGTLDVIAGNSADSQATSLSVDPQILQFAKTHGLSNVDAMMICEGNNESDSAREQALWETACRLAAVSMPTVQDPIDESMLNDELEALEAIFAEDCHVSRKDESIVTVQLPLDTMYHLIVTLDSTSYPQSWPERILVQSSDNKAWSQGLSLLVETAKFLSTDAVIGEPMLFTIHGHVLELLQTLGELPVVTLARKSAAPKEPSSATRPANAPSPTATPPPAPSAQLPRKRPRERSPFWSVPPNKTPPANPFPPGALRQARASLPAAKARDDFIKALRHADQGSHVVLCTGETGCGKSTQLPQFILEEYPKEAKIVVCQPRRLAATGVANRVADERGESSPGEGSIGYVVRGDSAMGKNSRLVFCTTGVLLRQLQNESALSCLTHIVIDEVHERNLDTDILLALLKQSLPTNPHLRVVLMSATLDAERFLGYWDGETPSIHIPGRTFPVQDFTLEDVLAVTKYIPPKPKGKGGRTSRDDDWDEPGADDDEDVVKGVEEETIGGHSIADLVKRVDEKSINYDLLAQLVRYLISNRDPSDDGSILIFLPGAPEIDRALETVKKGTRGSPVLLLPLHGGLQPKEQNRVFQPAGGGLYKVVFSTNVAETSVTIPDCTIVIDSAREKQSSYDPSNRMPLLLEQFCSKASLKQRRGRAGRVREGTCYKLISKATMTKLRDHGEPEIRRSALDQTLLSILFLGMECRPKGGFMESLLDPPDRSSIEAAAVSLQSLGALEVNATGGYSLTPLGVHLAGIPAPPIVGKILIMGAIMGCRDAALAMSATMSAGRSPFLRIDTRRKPKRGGDEPESMEEMKQKRILEERKALFQTVGNSDHALLAAVYMKWESLPKGAPRKQYCESMGLAFNGMRDIAQLARQLDSALQGIGYRSSAGANRNGQSWRIIRAVAVAGMAPGQLVKVVRPAAAYLETAEGAKEKDGNARELKFFVRTDATATPADSRANEERVFIHPSSSNFSTGAFSCPWLVFFSLVRTSKPFLRDVTECNSYALLLFGGPIEVQASKDIVLVDRWCQLGAHARIGSLMGGLRKRLDQMLVQKIVDPLYDIAASKEMSVIVRLIMTDGLGT